MLVHDCGAEKPVCCALRPGGGAAQAPAQRPGTQPPSSARVSPGRKRGGRGPTHTGRAVCFTEPAVSQAAPQHPIGCP